MDIEQLKLLWQQMDTRMLALETQQHKIQLQRRLQTEKQRLLPLLLGQILQLVFGLSIMLLGAHCWYQQDAIHLQLTGVLLLLHGALSTLLAGATASSIIRLDIAGPVLATQKRVARLNYLHALSGLFIGLPWWILWLPFMMALAALSGHDLLTTGLRWAYINLIVGFAGLAITLLVLTHIRRDPDQSAWQALIHRLGGRRLRQLQCRIDEIARFGHE